MAASKTVCPKCLIAVLPEFYFCPNCGKQLRERPITFGKEVVLYLICLLLPPLGLIPSIRYFFYHDRKTKIIGLVGIVLTLISFGITVYLTSYLMNMVTQQLNSVPMRF